jgi:hypothetical protein
MQRNQAGCSPCTVTVESLQRFCWWHDPVHADQRRRAASKAGKVKPSRELAGIKARLSDLADDVLEGRTDTGVAAVASQVLSVERLPVSRVGGAEGQGGRGD